MPLVTLQRHQLYGLLPRCMGVWCLNAGCGDVWGIIPWKASVQFGIVWIHGGLPLGMIQYRPSRAGLEIPNSRVGLHFGGFPSHGVSEVTRGCKVIFCHSHGLDDLEVAWLWKPPFLSSHTSTGWWTPQFCQHHHWWETKTNPFRWFDPCFSWFSWLNPKFPWLMFTTVDGRNPAPH